MSTKRTEDSLYKHKYRELLKAIDEIKAEIKDYDYFILCVNGQKGIHIDEALKIIDKHIGEIE